MLETAYSVVQETAAIHPEFPNGDNSTYVSLWRGEFIVGKPVPNTMAYLAVTVAERYGITVAQLKSGNRFRMIAWPRQELMWLCREEKWFHGGHRFSFPQIGRFLNRDHTTIIYGVRRYEERIASL